jgi:serine protease Do
LLAGAKDWQATPSPRRLAPLAALVLVFSSASAFAFASDELAGLEEAAFRAAAARVAPSVVRIETVGGLERVGQVLFGTGPTTGLVVSADGHIITSAFNFAQKPTSILVGLPDGSRAPARLVATDHNRMLCLIKVETDEPLPVPEAAPEESLAVGQWSIAVGRTYEGQDVNVSVGIISGLRRVWGKAVQTDAKVSPANYGGPLVDLHGRVIGVLVPLSPQASGEVAGVEWYDSGIGFAVPLAHVQSVLPRLSSGEDLKSGIMGVSFPRASEFASPAVIAACRPGSPAWRAGLRAGDRIVQIDGRPIERVTQVREQLANRYAGDKLQVIALRGDERMERAVELVAVLSPYFHPFLGILPARGASAAPGLAVRYVYAYSPAAKAGLLPGDVIVSLNGTAVTSRDDLRARLGDVPPEEPVRLSVRRADQSMDLDLLAARQPEHVPTDVPPPILPLPPAGEERPATGRIDLELAGFQNECAAYVPDSYNPAMGLGVVVWLSSADEKPDEQFAVWKRRADQDGLAILLPRPASGRQWSAQDAAYLEKLLDHVAGAYTIDRARVCLMGRETGGAMALQFAFTHRDRASGVAAFDAPVPARIPENEPLFHLSVFLAPAEKGRISASRVEEGAKRLRDLNYPVTMGVLGSPSGPIEEGLIEAIGAWADVLDRI